MAVVVLFVNFDRLDSHHSHLVERRNGRSTSTNDSPGNHPATDGAYHHNGERCGKFATPLGNHPATDGAYHHNP